MKLTLLILLFPLFLFSQKDTLIKTNIYQSFFSFKYHNPKWVSYKLYKGGGDCQRSQFRFKEDNIKTATVKDYSHSGYDIGHFASAEDFAFDCSKMELTFRFYNAVPQYPNLNRGLWKVYETKIREISQTDSLLIICGAIYVVEPGNKIINTSIWIPKYCYKIVKSLTTNKILYCLLFTNEKEINSVRNVKLSVFSKYSLPIGKVVN